MEPFDDVEVVLEVAGDQDCQPGEGEVCKVVHAAGLGAEATPARIRHGAVRHCSGEAAGTWDDEDTRDSAADRFVDSRMEVGGGRSRQADDPRSGEVVGGSAVVPEQ